MKNCDRPRFLADLACVIASGKIPEDVYDKYFSEYEFGFMNADGVYNWLRSECFELHEWEDWELQVMKHTSKDYITIKRDDNGNALLTSYYFGKEIVCFLGVNLPSLKSGEEIDIDKELKRYGVKR